jgi:hypothetical protein
MLTRWVRGVVVVSLIVLTATGQLAVAAKAKRKKKPAAAQPAVAAKPKGTEPAPKTAKTPREVRAVLPFDLGDAAFGGGISIVGADDSPGASQVRAERPGEQLWIPFSITSPGMSTPTIPGAVGSELRFGGQIDMGTAGVSVAHGGRLCFRKAKEGWVYVCGQGQVRVTDTGKVTNLGAARTVGSCLDLLSSPDAILREGGARDLGRLATAADVPRVVPRLAELLRDSDEYVRSGAAEALGLIGRQECLSPLRAGKAKEQDWPAKGYFSEALALCAVNALIGAANAPQLTGPEAARLFNEGETGWATETAGRRVIAAGAAAALMPKLSSADPQERAAAAVLLGAARYVPAKDALKRLWQSDPDENVRSAATRAFNRLVP